jgi:LPXTG-motif cell wall-anchored protein
MKRTILLTLLVTCGAAHAQAGEGVRTNSFVVVGIIIIIGAALYLNRRR